MLKLPADTLWNLSKDPESKGLDLLRYAMYHTPSKDDDKALGGVRLQGHTDFNRCVEGTSLFLSLLFPRFVAFKDRRSRTSAN